MTKVIYKTIGAVDMSGKLIILLELSCNNEHAHSLCEELDYKTACDISDEFRPKGWDSGQVYEFDIIITYIRYMTECGYESDSDIDFDNFKLLKDYNKNE